MTEPSPSQASPSRLKEWKKRLQVGLTVMAMIALYLLPVNILHWMREVNEHSQKQVSLNQFFQDYFVQGSEGWQLLGLLVVLTLWVALIFTPHSKRQVR